MQEVFGFKGYGHALYGNVIAGAGVVADVCPHSERHWFGLEETGVSEQMATGQDKTRQDRVRAKTSVSFRT